MAELYPLIFAPVFKERVWGGRKLARWFADLPAGPIGEAWVLSDHPQGRTAVVNGPLAGQTLSELKARFGTALVGTRGESGKTGEFPLLFKLLDSEADLSVQVHPRDDYAGLPPGELGKTEMWVVLDAAPGAKAIYGLKEGVTPDSFGAAVEQGQTMDVLQQREVHAGDVLYVPAGTIHALGAGLLVAEIQQSSDTVYRVYDYGRLGLDGKPRELHVEHALAVTDYGTPPAPVHPAQPPINRWEVICQSPYFAVAQGAVRGQMTQVTGGDSFQVVMVLEGAGAIAWEGGRAELAAGNTVLVPAGLGAFRLEGEFHGLLVWVP